MGKCLPDKYLPEDGILLWLVPLILFNVIFQKEDCYHAKLSGLSTIFQLLLPSRKLNRPNVLWSGGGFCSERVESFYFLPQCCDKRVAASEGVEMIPYEDLSWRR